MPDTSPETGKDPESGRDPKTGRDPGTPLYDAVLSDRLQAAALSVAQAEQDADAFLAALDRSQTDALEQLAQHRARELVVAQTLTVTTQRDLLERQARVAGDRLAGLAAWHAGDPACRACGEVMPCTTTQVLAGAAAPAIATPASSTPALSTHPIAVRGAAATTPETEPVGAEQGPAVAVAPITLEAQAVASEAVHHGAASEVHHEPPAEPVEPTKAPVGPAERPAVMARDGGPSAADVPSVPSMKHLFSSTRAASWLDNLLGAKR